MPADPTPPPKPTDLQFEKVDAAGGAMVCSACGTRITGAYFHLAGKPICGSCKQQVETQFAQMVARGRGAGGMMRAVIFGFGAAIAGAAVYYAVIALTNLEIGIVAILIGYMVGWAVRKATAGVGGRRFQFLAVALTYFAVGLAYTPLALKEFMADKKGKAVAMSHSTAADSGAIRDSTPTEAAATTPGKSPSLALGLLLMAVLILALPVLSIIGSMPSGILSAIIIGVGLRQAWRMTAAANIAITGPYKIGSPPPAAT